MWDVIVWDSENAIDFVPSIWANADRTLYKYPVSISQQKKRQIIYDCIDLVSNYKWYAAKPKVKDVKTLKRAQELCEQGQYTSNIESDEELETEPSKGRNKSRNRCSDFVYNKDDESASDSEPAPRSSRYKIPDDIDDDNDNECSTPKRFKYNTPSGEDRQKEIPKCSQKFLTETKGLKRQECSTANNMYEGSRSSKTQSLRDNNNVSISQNLNFTSSPLSTNNLSLVNNSNEIFNQILKNQSEIKYYLKSITKKVEELENAIISNRRKYVEPPSITPVIISLLPLKEQEDILKLESYLTEEDNFSDLVHFLYIVGGETPTKTITLIMKKLIKNELASKYSGVGKKKKLPFCHLKIYSAVEAATRKRHPNTSDEAIRKGVSLYLAQSKSRLSKINSGDTC